MVSYNALINGLCKASRVTEAVLLNEEMQKRGSFPDEVTFKLIIAGLIRENKLSMACRVWDKMMEKGFKLDRALSETLINAIKSSDAYMTLVELDISLPFGLCPEWIPKSLEMHDVASRLLD